MPNVIPQILMHLKYSGVSCLNLDFVAFSLSVKKSNKNMAKLGWKDFTFSNESVSRLALKASNVCQKGNMQNVIENDLEIKI